MDDRTILRDQWGNLAVTVSCKVAVIHENKVWLRKNERDDWELPGGRLEEGEQPEETAKREIYEELGIRLSELDLIDVYIWKTDFDSATYVELATFRAETQEVSGMLEFIGEAGPAEFKLFGIREALELSNLPEPYKRALRKI